MDVRVLDKRAIDKAWKVLVITVDSAERFPEWAEGNEAASKLVPGLGDLAFAGPKGEPGDAKMLAFRKGPRAVRIISALSASDARHVSEDQLMKLAKLIDSRMP